MKPYGIESGWEHGGKWWWTSWKRYRTMRATLQALSDLKKQHPSIRFRPVHIKSH